ncbi:Serine/threonine-protein kinase Pkn1 [Thalassoglobus neptunius]|uniref:Serine/threonine-protein kinase Pkn1 n=1 Tax=Thalassoglobus neptunius TaxID=1938619 RepID=A0A5C5VQ45_9PLAN|nr:serine/threonine-protein kinase [Thalassoglobus neptunius]TWT40055.1 Serine/threonine-protein kinase Pkn1 [Thalassoglobus neptunius]
MPIKELFDLVSILAPVIHAGYPYVRDGVQRFCYTNRQDRILEFLGNLGATTDQQIRRLVDDWDRQQNSPLDERTREQLCATLINLSHGAKFLTTQGTLRSSLVRSEKMIDLLLSHIETQFKKGDQIAPGHDWYVERFLGMGSFGEVWMGINQGYPESRAFKFFTQEDGKDWLLREQSNLWKIKQKLNDHPNVIQYLDVVTNCTYPFLALEYAGGGSLEDWILEDSENRVDLLVSDAVRGLIDGIAEAHRWDICHRDLKPANIILTKAQSHPQIKITDFGLAKDFNERQQSNAGETISIGTPLYLPPEASTPGREVDGFRADVFAIGVIWYQLLTNSLERPPYDFASRLRDHAADSHTIRVLTRCLASPEHRYANAMQLREDLSEIIPFRVDIPDGVIDVQHVFREYLSE